MNQSAQGTEEALKELTKRWREYRLPRWQELPDIELYMDQVLIYLEKHFGIFQENYSGALISSSIINNYVKQGIVPPTNKKKYGKEHLAYLIMICLLKSTLSMTDIQSMLQTEAGEDMLRSRYDRFCAEQEAVLKALAERLDRGEVATSTNGPDADATDATEPSDISKNGQIAVQLALEASVRKLGAERLIQLQRQSQSEPIPKKSK